MGSWFERQLERLADKVAPKVVERIFQKRPSDGRTSDTTQEFMVNLALTPTLFGGGWDRVKLGKNVKLVNTLLNVTSGRIEIGDDSFFGHNVCLLTGTHDISSMHAARQEYVREGRDIVIGKGVWIASNATIIGPCLIGDNAVVAAGAVVVGGKLESGCLYGGVPARMLKRPSAEE